MMTKFDSFLWTIKNASPRDWYESVVWVAYMLVGSLIPVYISILILLVWQQRVCLIDFTRHAQFAIYSASVLAGSAYVVLRDFKRRPFPRRGIFGVLLIVGIVTATALFASVTVSSKVAIISHILSADEELVRNVSVVLFASTILMAFIINILDCVVTIPELRTIEARHQADLAKSFEDLGGKDEQQ